jgi:hypothetical protein
MPNLTNQSLRTDKRVEALLRQEMTEHQSVISAHHKEMQTLRDSLKLAIDRFDSLYEHSAQELKDLALYSNQQFLALKEKVMAHEMCITTQKQTIIFLNTQLQEFHSIYSSKADGSKLKIDLSSQVKEATTSHLKSFQDCQQEVYSIFNSLKEDLIKLRVETTWRLDELNEKIAIKSNASRLEKDGVLKEVRVWEKSIFVIEKKLENIYTLIERINKRGEACHKPE